MSLTIWSPVQASGQTIVTKFGTLEEFIRKQWNAVNEETRDKNNNVKRRDLVYYNRNYGSNIEEGGEGLTVIAEKTATFSPFTYLKNKLKKCPTPLAGESRHILLKDTMYWVKGDASDNTIARENIPVEVSLEFKYQNDTMITPTHLEKGIEKCLSALFYTDEDGNVVSSLSNLMALFKDIGGADTID